MRRQTQIDGLRAIAIISVLFYHTAIPFFSGGFIGVDIFFVISGYLIANVLNKYQSISSQTIFEFLENRSRRIVPALFVMLIITVPFAYFILIPADYLRYSNGFLSIITLASNIYFWSVRDGYFDKDSFLSPLIHTWSLGVEVQFYLLTLFLFALVNRFNRFFVNTSIFLISLTLSILLSKSMPGASFFLFPFRGWELIFGAIIFLSKDELISYSATSKHSLILQNILSATGLGGILCSILIFDKHFSWPSYHAILPVISSGLVIVFATKKTFTFRMLSTSPFIFFGAISYSLYLYHQPVFSFFKHIKILEPTSLEIFLCILVTILISYISYKFVELPFKSKKFISIKNFLYCFTFLAILLIAVQFYSSITSGLKFRFQVPEAILESLERPKSTLNCYYQDSPIKNTINFCNIGPQSSPISYLVVGDSHALSLFPALSNAANSNLIHGIFISKLGCIPLIDTHLLNNQNNECKKFNDLVFESAKTHKIKDVYLIAKWNLYLNGGYDGLHLSPLLYGESNTINYSASAQLKLALKSTIDAYQSIGVNVHILKQVPQQLLSPQKIYYNFVDLDDPTLLPKKLQQFAVRRSTHDKLNEEFNYLLSGLAVDKKKLKIFSLDSVFCDLEFCRIGDTQSSYYYDNNHLSTNGALLASPLILEFLRPL